MKITMIGKSSSGKTSFMSGLHEKLGTGRVNGFYMSPSTTSMPDGLKKNRQYDEISFKHLKYNFPEGTQTTTVWSFDLEFRDQNVCSLEWIDYRGGIIEEVFDFGNPGDQLKDEEISELVGHISISNAVLLFADSIVLSHYKNPRERAIHTGADNINEFMRLYSRSHPGRNLTIVIVLTKADSDLIPEEHKANNYKVLIERGKESFSEIVELCKDNSDNWNGAIVPVDVLGNEQCKSVLSVPVVKNSDDFSKNLLPIKVDTKITGFPVPVNVEHPLFFSIGNTLDKMKSHSKLHFDIYKKEYEKLLSKSNMFNTFWSRITKSKSPQETAQHFLELMKSEEENLEGLRNHINPVLEISKQQIQPLL